MNLTILIISNTHISSNTDYIHCLSAWTHWRDAFIWLLWSQGQRPFPKMDQESRLLSSHLLYMKCWGYNIIDFKSNLCDESIAMLLVAFRSVFFSFKFFWTHSEALYFRILLLVKYNVTCNLTQIFNFLVIW